jgi:hypothetical protein
MTVTNSLSRQPIKIDYASPTQFKFNLLKLPTVEYFCTSVNIPGINLDFIEQKTTLKNIPIPGNRLTYADLTMSFLVDENLTNYQEIHGWLTGLGYPEDNSQFANMANANSDRFPTSNQAGISTEPGQVNFGAASAGSTVSDATLMILTSKNNPVVEVRFRDVFPVSLSGLNYNQQATDIQYLTAEVTFKYLIYDFASVNSSTTTTTIT